MATESNTGNTGNTPNPTPPETTKKRAHPQLGEYRKCIISLTAAAQQNTNVFVSINTYTAEIKPDIEVELPVEVIKFLKTSYALSHYFDKNAVSENGNKGAHATKQVKKYIVELV